MLIPHLTWIIPFPSKSLTIKTSSCLQVQLPINVSLIISPENCLGTSMQFLKFKMSLKWWNRLIKINYSNKYQLKKNITKVMIYLKSLLQLFSFFQVSDLYLLLFPGLF